MGAQSALGRRRRTLAEIDARLVALVDRVTRRMRAAGRVGRTVILRLRFDDFTRATRSRTLWRPTADTQTILLVARELLVEAGPELRRRGLTLVGITVTNLEDARALQLVLPFALDRREALDAALDAVRDRYGTKAVTRGVLLGRELGPAVPLLPD